MKRTRQVNSLYSWRVSPALFVFCYEVGVCLFTMSILLKYLCNFVFSMVFMFNLLFSFLRSFEVDVN